MNTIFQHEQTCQSVFRNIGERETKTSSLRSNDVRGNLTTRMPTWTATQCHHQNTELEATLSVKICVSKIFRKSPQRRLERRRALGHWKRLEYHQALRDQLQLDASNTGEKKVHLLSNTDGENYIRKFDDIAKNFKRCGKVPNNLQAFPITIAIWTQVTSDLLEDFILADQGVKTSSEWR